MEHKNKIRVTGLLVISVGLAACGGGGGGGGEAGGNVSVSGASDSPGGIWQGTVVSEGTGLTYQSIGFVTETGELRFLTEDGEQTVGTVAVNGNTFTANLTSYAPIGTVFSQNGLTVINGTASGTVFERISLSGSASVSGVVTSTFSYNYDPIYERDSSLSVISGVYSESDGFGYTVTYAIDTNGVISGSDTDGCQFSGSIRIINSNYNMYRINTTVTNCGDFNGDYTGLAALMDEGGSQNDTLGYSVSGSKYVISGSIPRT